ncbi:hypothetical protein [Cellulomonas sp. NS3]|uniref:hypothetical protein n=1 Tax=Cellulomonas sp. NS3 TaxID=2973977 RepID=UPI002162D3FF|nr:hypothetical protein [Cellulomonas sp. NS3]
MQDPPLHPRALGAYAYAGDLLSSIELLHGARGQAGGWVAATTYSPEYVQGSGAGAMRAVELLWESYQAQATLGLAHDLGGSVAAIPVTVLLESREQEVVPVVALEHLALAGVDLPDGGAITLEWSGPIADGRIALVPVEDLEVYE